MGKRKIYWSKAYIYMTFIWVFFFSSSFPFSYHFPFCWRRNGHNPRMDDRFVQWPSLIWMITIIIYGKPQSERYISNDDMFFAGNAMQVAVGHYKMLENAISKGRYQTLSIRCNSIYYISTWLASLDHWFTS